MPVQPVITDPDDIYVRDRLLAVAPFDRVEFAKTFEHRVAFLDDQRIHYVVGGSGPVIVFGHGWPASWYEWRKVLPQLAPHFTCVALDLPGFGDSSPPPAFDPGTIAGLIRRFIREVLGEEQVYIVGHDISGPPMAHLAAHNPELVTKLFLTETAVEGPEMGGVIATHMKEIWHFPVNAARLTATMWTGREWNFVPQYFTDWVYNPAAITPEDLAEYVRVNQRPGAAECGAAYYSAPPSHGPDEDVLPPDSLSMPFKFLAASEGFGGHLGGDTQAAFKTLERFATDAEYEVVDKCGHWVTEDRPVFLAESMTEFFQR